LLTVAGECDDDEDDDGHWWWQSEAGKPGKWKVPQWEVLAANRVGWEAGLKKVKVNERETGVSERQLVVRLCVRLLNGDVDVREAQGTRAQDRVQESEKGRPAG
jgi:hypothetical protein